MSEREEIISRLRIVLEPLPFIYALWLEGADATGTADEYSDLDFWIDIDDEYEPQAFDAVEAALSEIAPIDYNYEARKGHPLLRQRIYHLSGTSEYLLIDFNAQLHSRPRDEYKLLDNDSIEAAWVLFDKDNIIRHKPFDLSEFADLNKLRFAEAAYRRSQHVRAEKYVRRGLYLEAYAYYNRYVLEPLIDLLRLIYTPAHADYYLVHISQHLPAAEREKLEFFTRIATLDDIAAKIPQAGVCFDELTARVCIYG